MAYIASGTHEVHIAEEVQAADMSRLRRFSFVAILMIVAAFTYLDFWGYSALFHSDPTAVDTLINGQGLAPQQYRVGILFVAKFLSKLVHGHLSYRHFFAIFDFVCGVASALLLREVLFRTQTFLAAGLASRLLRLVGLLGLVAYYLNWTTWYQRPETLACTLFVAASYFLLSVVRTGSVIAVGLVVLAVLQGFIRADVAILFHFALFVYVLSRGARGFTTSRGWLLGASFFGGLLPTAILWFLMHKVYPHATYGDTPVFQLIRNLAPTQLAAGSLFLLPTLYTFFRARKDDASGEGVGHTLLLASAIYFCSWVAVGRFEEVRIFVPFAFALMPQTANAIARLAHRA